MDKKEFVSAYWNDVITQNNSNLGQYFNSDAVINCHNTNSSFTVAEFIESNSRKLVNLTASIEKNIDTGDQLITMAKIRDSVSNIVFHVTSFIQIENDRISKVNEYWGNGLPFSELRNK